MSNLIKSVYFNVDPSKVRVIDSDEQIEEYIPEIYDKKPEIETFQFQSLTDSEAPDDLEAAKSFEDGLSVISMDEVVEQEREKLSKEMEEEQEKILASARQEAQEIVSAAQEQAEVIREQARSEGEQQGRDEGRMQAQEELNQMRQELQEEYDRQCQELREQEENLEPAFAELVVSLVRKLTGVVCEDKKDVILYLIGNAMKKLEKTKQIMIRVSKEDVARVSAKKATFQMIAKGVEEFDIMEDASLTQGQCIIETDNKIIDCSLDVQLQNLEEQIKMLAF